MRCGPFPLLRGPAALIRELGAGGSLRFSRFMLLPANRMVTELFRSEQARLPILGNAMHADIPLDAPGSGAMGYLLTMLAQDTGFPVPTGGAGALTAALVRKCEALGVEIVRDCRAVGIDVESGRATALYRDLLPEHAVPQRVLDDLESFEWDTPVVKINYALSAKMPWVSRNLAGAGTVHVGADRPGLVRWMADLNAGVVPEKPFMLIGQMTTADPSRSPGGTESAWAYTHLPRGIDDTESATLLAGRVDDVLEAHPPGFRDLIIGRAVQTPQDLVAADENLQSGAVNGGTSQLHQQLFFRPSPGLGRAETPVRQLFLGSASAIDLLNR